MAKIEEKIEELIKGKIENLGYELYDVIYVKEGKDYFLRIFIDKPEGIYLNDCENVNNSINNLLDEADYIKESYFLEVSSPGIERVLRKEKHFIQNIGNTVEVKLFKAIKSNKEIIGKLKEFNNSEIILQTEKGDIIILKDNISIIKTRYNW